MSWVPQRHWKFPCYSHTRDVIGPVFQPDCRLVAVTLPQGGKNDKKKNHLLFFYTLYFARHIFQKCCWMHLQLFGEGEM
jgi:hypothetical protein